jgi:polyisoprenoid-binding protein YceI
VADASARLLARTEAVTPSFTASNFSGENPMTHFTPLAAGIVAALALAAGTAQAQTATYSVDPTHTFVTFEALHFGTSLTRGRFDKKEGTIQFDRAGKTGKVDISIDMASINTGVAPFDKHLLSADFFNAAAHPSARFVADGFVFEGDKVARVNGTLTLLGKTGPVALVANRFNCYDNPFFKRQVCGGDFETTIKRSQWGMSYGLPGIPDDVRLVIQVEAVKQ